LSFTGDRHIALDKQHQRLNGEINAPEIRLVGVEGEQLGIVPLAEAMAKAEAAELDLVEIAPMAEPPVCRIMDYGKFRFEQAKKASIAKKKQKNIQVKEVTHFRATSLEAFPGRTWPQHPKETLRSLEPEIRHWPSCRRRPASG